MRQQERAGGGTELQSHSETFRWGTPLASSQDAGCPPDSGGRFACIHRHHNIQYASNSATFERSSSVDGSDFVLKRNCRGNETILCAHAQNRRVEMIETVGRNAGGNLGAPAQRHRVFVKNQHTAGFPHAVEHHLIVHRDDRSQVDHFQIDIPRRSQAPCRPSRPRSRSSRPSLPS